VVYYIDILYTNIQNNIMWMGHYIMNVDGDCPVNILRLRTEYSQYPCYELLYSVSSTYKTWYIVPAKIAPHLKKLLTSAKYILSAHLLFPLFSVWNSPLIKISCWSNSTYSIMTTRGIGTRTQHFEFSRCTTALLLCSVWGKIWY